MKKLSETYKKLGIAFTFPIKIKDKNGNATYYEYNDDYWCRKEYDKNGNTTCYENSHGYWCRREYNENGNETYYENSDGYWCRSEYDKNCNLTYYEDSDGIKQGTKKGSCAGKIVEVDGKKYKLTEL